MVYLRTFVLSILCSSWLVASDCSADERPYTDGSVWTVTFVRTKPGMNNTYFRELAANWKKVLDEARKEQLVVSYKILAGNPANYADWNLMLLVEVKNWAALDGADEKFETIVNKLVGPETKRNELMVQLGDMREILGSKNVQEVILN